MNNVNRFQILSIFEGFIDGWNIFHFNGAYNGFHIKKVMLRCDMDLDLGEEYYIEAEEINIFESKLYGNILSVVNLNQIRTTF